MLAARENLVTSSNKCFSAGFQPRPEGRGVWHRRPADGRGRDARATAPDVMGGVDAQVQR